MFEILEYLPYLYAQMPLIKAQAEVSSKTRHLNFGLSLQQQRLLSVYALARLSLGCSLMTYVPISCARTRIQKVNRVLPFQLS